MFINKLNQLYKPGRILYYTDADDSAIADFRSGKISDSVNRYAGSFGAYDYPGIFYIKSLGKPLLESNSEEMMRISPIRMTFSQLFWKGHFSIQ